MKPVNVLKMKFLNLGRILHILNFVLLMIFSGCLYVVRLPLRLLLVLLLLLLLVLYGTRDWVKLET